MIYDFAVVGGGIVGLAAALALMDERDGVSVLLVEKEDGLAQHQTGHNSGVIHAGIYYAPGSLKARLCREGLDSTIAFCREHNIAFEQCGKLIVATNAIEEQRIDAIYERATGNGLDLRRVSEGELKELEPNIRGTRALLSPKTGIVDYRAIAAKMAALITERGGTILTGREVKRIQEGPAHVEFSTGIEAFAARKVIFCGGLQADRLARLAGLDLDFRIVPFRGEYFRLPDAKSDIARHLIYPAPDPSLPFLGVHLTRMIDGSMTVGPNAVLGWSREGYKKFSTSLPDVASYVAYPGFWRMLWANRRHAIHELEGSLFRKAYLEECRKYCPSLTLDDLLPYRAGIRAQVVMRDGTAVHDFLIKGTARTLHVCNAPSPAATSAFPIGKMIARHVLEEMPLS